MDNYVIEFKGLKEGIHQYEFSLKKEFFERINDSQIEDGDLQVNISVIKQTNLLTFETEIFGEVIVECDRCLDKYSQDIDFDGNLFVKLSDRVSDEEESNEDVIFISSNDHQIDLRQYLYESIILSIPYKKVHPGHPGEVDGCNVDMMEKLVEHQTTEENNETDPRWDELKNLMNKKK